MKTTEYTTRQVLDAIALASVGGINLDTVRLHDWHKRGILGPDPVGKGNDRTYDYTEVCFIASLALFADRTRNLLMARQVAQVHASLMAEKPRGYLVLIGGAESEFIALTPEMKVSRVAAAYGQRGAVLVNPGQLAIQLRADLDSYSEAEE